ncbi:MAG: hypothetical protein WBM13_07325 [Bacteroidia bacterium]
MKQFNKITLSGVTIFIVALFVLFIDFSLENYKKEKRVIEWDVHSYYAYLPAFFIYDDIKLEKSDYKFGKDYYLFWPTTIQDNRNVIKTSMGLSFLYAPFFFVGHGIALLTDSPESGFSEPYKLLLLLSAVFYLIVGLDFVRKILVILNFSDKQIAVTLFLIGVGTNLLCYSSTCGTMSHVYSFCLFAMFIYYCIKWYEYQSLKTSLMIGFLLGLISLVRPTNSIIALLLLFYGVSSWQEMKARIAHLWSNFKYVFVIVICAFVVWIPQLVYWKTITGQFFYFSYIGERFYFNDPKIIDGLFSFRKGWLLYTPIMLFALIGIIFLKNNLKKLQLPTLLFVVLNIYIAFSWWCWWYGGSFGQRSMVESYALLAVPLAGTVKIMSEKKLIARICFYSTLFLLVCLNIFQTYQFENMSLHYDGMTATLYFKQFGKVDRVKDYDLYVNSPDYEKELYRNGKPDPIVENNGKIQADTTAPIHNYFTQKKELWRKTIFLKGYNNLFVCAEGENNKDLFANKEIASTWETYTLVMFENNQCALLSFTNNFLCTELNNKTELSNTRNQANSWETFSIVYVDDKCVAFKAFNGNYITVNEETKRLYANAKELGEREKFEIISAINP